MTNDRLIPRLEDAAYTNISTAQDYFDRLMLLATSEFKWIGLPETCDERFIELGLFKYGKMCFCNDLRYGLISPNLTYGNFDMYGNPLEINPYTPFSNISFDRDKGFVLIRNNALSTPTLNTVSLYARRLASVERILDVTVNNLKRPSIS